MSKIDKIVKEELAKVVNENTNDHREPLLEMAYPRVEFISEVKNKTNEIIRNYALVYYANKHNIPTINHWRGEFLTHITDIQDMETKPKRGNRKMVFKAIQEVWIDKMELSTHPLTIVHKYITKFQQEGFVLSDDEHMEIAQSFIDNLDTLIREMAYGDYNSSWNFVNSF